MALSVLVAGCGGSSGGSATAAPSVGLSSEQPATVTQTVGADTTVPPSADTSSELTSSPEPVVTVTSVVAPDVPSAAPVVGQTWQSPSGNIRCATGGSDLVTCVITTIEFLGPAGCPTGPVSVALPRGAGDPVVGCAGTTPVDARVLAYQESVTETDLTCTSTERGMNCANVATGTAFLLSKAGVVDPNAVLTLTPDGLGPLRMGMTVDEVLAVEPGFVLSDNFGSPCRSGNVTYAHLTFNPDGGLALITTEDQPMVRTADGLSIGDSASRIADLYRGRTQILGDGGGSWVGVNLDESAGLQYWIFTNFSGDAYAGDDPFSSAFTVQSIALNRDQMCVS